MFHPSFYVGSGIRKGKKCSDPDPGWKNVRIRDATSRIRNTVVRTISNTGGVHNPCRYRYFPYAFIKFITDILYSAGPEQPAREC
jgi:hypothetical protein